MFASKDQFFAGTKGYQLTRSLRFRASATAYLNRTFGTPTSANKWTLSQWIKRGKLGSPDNGLFHAGALSVSHYYEFTVGDALQFVDSGGFTTTRLFRDPSSWYHIVLAVDAAAAGSNKIRVYVNGTEETSFSSDTRSSWTGGTFNAASTAHYLALAFSTSYVLDGYMAEVNFIDGQQLTPSSFGQTDTATGVWVPKKYTGTYGNNGFYLPLTDTSSTTNLVKDSSGNGNNWTPNNISLTAGTTYDSMIDVPYCTGQTGGTQPSGNYATLSPLNASIAPVDGNLAILGSSASFLGSRGTIAIPKTGKWYVEATAVSSSANLLCVSIIPMGASNSANHNSANVYSYMSDGTIRYGGVDETAVSSYTTGDIIGIYVNDGAITMYKNNTSVKVWSQNLTTISDNYAFGGFAYTAYKLAYNFGQRPFTYTPPSGAQALCAANLATPTIKNGAGYMAATTYTGTGASLSVTNTVGSTSFQPDLAWIKSRSAATNNNLFDAIRGTTNYLISNSTAANASNANTLTAFNSNGFTVGTDASSIGVNVNTATYVGWQWLAGAGTTSSNTNGSITSTVCVNTTSGFSVVTYTGTGANATVGHGLGVAPSMVITKQRTAASTTNWATWHTSIANTNYLLLNTTAASTSGATYWNSTSPSSTVFSIGSAADTNTSTGTYVAYCFAAIAGYSAFGSYTGNGSTDGPFVYTGFRPRWIMYKNASAVKSWDIQDTSRDTYNVASQYLNANNANAEGTFATLDFLSNGFKIRTTDADSNGSTNTIIYAAFAENPFNYSLAR